LFSLGVGAILSKEVYETLALKGGVSGKSYVVLEGSGLEIF